MRRLARYLATWSDGKALVLHARTWADANSLARQLTAPAGVSVVDVVSIA